MPIPSIPSIPSMRSMIGSLGTWKEVTELSAKSSRSFMLEEIEGVEGIAEKAPCGHFGVPEVAMVGPTHLGSAEDPLKDYVQGPCLPSVGIGAATPVHSHTYTHHLPMKILRSLGSAFQRYSPS